MSRVLDDVRQMLAPYFEPRHSIIIGSLALASLDTLCYRDASNL